MYLAMYQGAHGRRMFDWIQTPEPWNVEKYPCRQRRREFNFILPSFDQPFPAPTIPDVHLALKPICPNKHTQSILSQVFSTVTGRFIVHKPRVEHIQSHSYSGGHR